LAIPQQDFPSWIRDTLDRRGRAVICSQGRSMQPAIPEGSFLEVRPMAPDELEPGDLIVYHRGGDVYCHRLLRKYAKECLVKGDALLAADPPVAWQQVLGRVAILIEDGERFVPLDAPEQRRRARWQARMTYPRAIFHRLYRTVRAMLQKETRP
jgi:hypothetical protein